MSYCNKNSHFSWIYTHEPLNWDFGLKILYTKVWSFFYAVHIYFTIDELGSTTLLKIDELLYYVRYRYIYVHNVHSTILMPRDTEHRTDAVYTLHSLQSLAYVQIEIGNKNCY